MNPGGWTCQHCKSWIPNGCSHSCPMIYQPNPSPQPSLAPSMSPTLGEIQIIAALERIVNALEQANGLRKAEDRKR